MSEDCIVVQEDGWTVGLRKRASRDRIPISCMLELTRRCNFRCQHCYLGDQDQHHARAAEERDTAAIMASMDEWAEAGCLNLCFTGGDPLIRPDFEALYRHATALGILVTVFCNGSLLTDRIVDLFRERPPRKVEISIYGATAATHDAVTRLPGSHALAWQGIRRLHQAGIRVELKTMVLTLNLHEWAAMKNQAEEMGCRFRYDVAVNPGMPDGSTGPLALRLSPEAAVALEMRDAERCRKWRESIERMMKIPENEDLYFCAAGKTMFYVDPFGQYSPCLVTTKYTYPAHGRTFGDIWREQLSEIGKVKCTRTVASFSGSLRGVCSHCPAVNYLETGDEETEPEFMRRITQLRYDRAMAAQE